MDQLELFPLATIPTLPEWRKDERLWELYQDEEPTGWTLHDYHRQCRALYPWALNHPDGRYLQSPYALGWSHADEARAAALRAYTGELQLYPASVFHWPSKGRPLTDCGHGITDIYYLEEVN
jgi:hypothetical protein